MVIRTSTNFGIAMTRASEIQPVDRFRKGKRTLIAVFEHCGVAFEGAAPSNRETAATVGVARRIGE